MVKNAQNFAPAAGWGPSAIPNSNRVTHYSQLAAQVARAQETSQGAAVVIYPAVSRAAMADAAARSRRRCRPGPTAAAGASAGAGDG